MAAQDPAWLELVALALGSGVVSSVVTISLQGWIEKKREDRADERREKENREATVKAWREGIATNRPKHSSGYQPTAGAPDSLPFITEPWFASLEPHLSDTVRSEIHKPTSLRPYNVNAHLDKLRDAADRKASEWKVT